MSSRSRHLLQIHLAVLLFGFAGLFGKWVLLDPIIIVFCRVGFAVPVLILASIMWRLPLRPRSWRSLLAYLALGVLLAVHWTTFFKSVQVSSIAVALITFSTFPVFVAFLEPLFFREKLHLGDVVLACIALAGVVILVPEFDLDDRIAQGACWGVASGVTFALLSLFNRRFVRHHSSITVALYQDAFAALALLPIALLEWPIFQLQDVLFLLVLGVLCTAVAHSLFIAGLKEINARTASMIACLEPVYGILLAAMLLDELPTGRTILGGVIVLGVALIATAAAQRRTGVI
jgi:drug/metabolite transporter (DMT)-like permease